MHPFILFLSCLTVLLCIVALLQRAGVVPPIIPFLNVQELPVVGDAPATIYDPLERPDDIHNSDERDIVLT